MKKEKKFEHVRMFCYTMNYEYYERIVIVLLMYVCVCIRALGRQRMMLHIIQTSFEFFIFVCEI